MSNTTPPKSLRSRMGTAMRRTSSILTLSRPNTPGVSSSPKPSQGTTGRARSSSVATSDSDISSASRPSVDTTAPTIPPISPPSAIMMPSPIAESPAREAAATADEIREELRESKVGPTPLTQVVTTSTDPGTPAETVESSRSEAGGPTILGSADEPHILTEEPDEMSLRAHTVESIRESDPNETREAPAPVGFAPAPELSPAPVLETAPSYFEIPAHPSSQNLSDSASLHRAIIENTMGVISTEEPTPEGMQSDQTTPRPHGPADTENANVFYAFSEMPVHNTSQVSTEEKPNFPNSAPGDIIPADLQRENEIVQMPVPEITGDMPAQLPPVTMPASNPIPIPPKRRDADIEPIPTPGTATEASVHHTTEFVSEKPQTKSSGIAIVPYDAGSVEEIWANQSDAQHNQDAVGRKRADSSAQTIQDPFADPVPSIHPSTIGTTGPSVVSEPDITATQNQTSVLTTQTVPNVVVFPIVHHEDIFTREANDDSVSGAKHDLFSAHTQHLKPPTFTSTLLSLRLPI
ncbi:uncharacterized protein C8R40DRAFT_736950 [Lentinula edodes]|uniref:uncharacterized protein n=1 Tax=Lentinula edodes TaxID=5353 RepID=UPI001E8E5E5B|nr:uncharacterized protein C8R40DRAFT_736950 [Lentinula edodes]KAH7869506.1 hypothetical protein C8R40DRAFT_736950 [Lentinula edodes]